MTEQTQASAIDASPEREYQAIVVEVSGRNTPSAKVVVQEMMAGEIADSMEDVFSVLGAILHQGEQRGKKTETAEDIHEVDMKSLLMLPPVRSALFNVTARSCGESPEFVRGLDMVSVVALTAAALKANTPFFSTLPALLGMLGKPNTSPANAK
jgi:hypothetical protein